MGSIELDAALESDGSVTCLVTDHGTWQPPDRPTLIAATA